MVQSAPPLSSGPPPPSPVEEQKMAALVAQEDQCSAVVEQPSGPWPLLARIGEEVDDHLTIISTYSGQGEEEERTPPSCLT